LERLLTTSEEPEMKVQLLRNGKTVDVVFSTDTRQKGWEIADREKNERRNMLIHVPVYILIGNNTISAPERSLLNLKASGKVTFIGSNSAGAAGPVCKTKITDKITLVYTTGQIVGLNNNFMSYQGTGIAPDIYVYPTAQGISEGRDEVLEKAIEIALKNVREKSGE
jgi:C-terminal processing protease CtpA/Prc